MKTTLSYKVRTMAKGFLPFYLFTLLPLISSCSDMLETSSELVEFEKDNTLNHTADSVYSVLGIINTIQTIADRTVLLGEVRGDLVITTDAASADLKRLSAFDFSQDNKYNRVSDYYAVINNCNYFLHHVDTTLERRGRKIFEREYAVVKTYRAWAYLQLAMAYGRVPLVTEPMMTENLAREAMNQPYKDIQEICDYFISDLTPYAMTLYPDFGVIDVYDAKQFFIPVRVLLGDLCLWAGRYLEAARWYNSYLNDEHDPVLMRIGSRSVWTDASKFESPRLSYNITDEAEYLGFIPMETQIFDGVVSDLENIFESSLNNKYYYQLTPSEAMRRTSRDQVYCMEYTTDSRTDTIYVPQKGLLYDMYAGDLRFSSNITFGYTVGQDKYSEYSTSIQYDSKIWSTHIPFYRINMVYLRYAEALNRAGFPQSAMCILKYGLCADNLRYIDDVEQEAAGSLITFDLDIFTRQTTIGVHSLGSGDSQANKYYVLPQPDKELPTRADTVNYQIPRVEDMIITEMALEGAFEGNRFNDLMRVAIRRNDPAYLANIVSRRNEKTDETLRQLLMNTNNWYLPLK